MSEERAVSRHWAVYFRPGDGIEEGITMGGWRETARFIARTLRVRVSDVELGLWTTEDRFAADAPFRAVRVSAYTHAAAKRLRASIAAHNMAKTDASSVWPYNRADGWVELDARDGHFDRRARPEVSL